MEQSEPAKETGATRLPLPYVIVALVAWAALTFGHKVGLKLAGQFFAWARKPGSLTAEGGASGMRVAEGALALFFGSIAVLIIVRLAFAMRQASREQVVDALVPWAAWAAILLGVWKTYIVYATELVHFGQYALVGFLVARALDGGRRPAVAFLVTVGLAVVDELFQHYGLALDNAYHWMDWSDIVLDALGATAGILPLVTLARLEGRELIDTTRTTRNVLLISAAVTLPLLLLPPVTVATVLGHYRHYPYWGEYGNDKPTHWPGPREGIPLALGAVLVLATLLEGRRSPLSHRALACLAVLWAVQLDPPSRKEGMPVHEVVPSVVARRARTPIVVDGRLDEEAWKHAAEVGPFVLLKTGAPSPSNQPTRAKVLWDDQRFYVAFDVVDRDVWARDTYRDDVYLPSDEVVEVFLDDGGDEVTYYELEVSPRNVVYDLFCFVASAPFDFNPDMPATGLPHWDAKAIPALGALGLETAVSVRGTLDTVAAGGTPVTGLDQDEGWTVELALPWSALWMTSRPGLDIAHRPVPPRSGDRWRLGLSRIERPRLAPPLAGQATFARDEALAHVRCTPERFEELVSQGVLAPDADGRFPVGAVQAAAYEHAAEYQTWSPTWDPGGSFHRPQFFGVLEFAE